MRKPTRLAMIGLSVLTSSALLAGTASAETPAYGDKFAARADAQAMTISLFGTQIAGSHATADLDAVPTGKATVSELILGGPLDSGVITASVSGLADATDTKAPPACPLDELEQIPGIARVDLVCPVASAAIAGQLPSARALGAELVLEPSVSTVLETLGLAEPVTAGANQIFEDVLNPLVQALTGNPIGDTAEAAVTTVQDVLNDTLTLNSTARIVVAPALAEVTSDATNITAKSHAQGVRIELLPVNEVGATNGLLPDDLLPGEPLITITVGEAIAKCVYTRSTDGGCTDAEASAAFVKIEFGSTALTDALGLSAQAIVVDPDTEVCVLQDTPLETCVAVAAAGVDADGNPYADATTLALFKGVSGGINIATGAVTAGSAGSAAPAAILPQGDLPRTGGSDALPIIGAGLLALAVLGRRVAIGRA